MTKILIKDMNGEVQVFQGNIKAFDSSDGVKIFDFDLNAVIGKAQVFQWWKIDRSQPPPPQYDGAPVEFEGYPIDQTAPQQHEPEAQSQDYQEDDDEFTQMALSMSKEDAEEPESEGSRPDLQETVEKFGIMTASEVNKRVDDRNKKLAKEIENIQAPQINKDTEETDPCPTCQGRGVVPDDESDDPLDTRMCPDC